MKPHKFFRKEIKEPDEFFTITGRVISFIKKEQKIVSWIGTILVALLALSIFWPRYQASKAEDAAIAFYYTAKLFDAEIVEKKEETTPVTEEKTPHPETFSSAKEKYTSILQKLQNIEKEYSKTPSAYYAQLFKGHTYFNLGEYDKAIESYNVFLKKTDKTSEFYLLTLNAIALCFEKKEAYSEAIAQYKKMLEVKGDFLKDLATYNIARCHEKTNNHQEAEKYYALVKDTFATSSLADEAKKHLLMLPTNHELTK